jgi:hypothetical protein
MFFRQFALNAEAPLLRIGPDCAGGNGGNVQGISADLAGAVRVVAASNIPDASVALREALRHA